MKILADQAIPYVKRLFSSLGDVALTDASGLTAAAVRDADCLVVRSVTRIDESLLYGAQVRCIASAASGTDHVDHDYLRARAIPLFPAKGSNARAVAEYVLSCLFVLSEQCGLDLESRTVGIVGCGHVGGELRRLLQLLKIGTRVYDPFIRDEHGCFGFRDLEYVLASDVISLHVPLTVRGEYPTTGMVDRTFLHRLSNHVTFINTARGGVVNERDLIEFATRNPQIKLVLDVWADEPYINPGLLNLTALATPHVAGYSARAKFNATRMVYERVCAWAGAKPVSTDGMGMGIFKGEDPELHLSGFSNPIEAIRTAALACYDVRTDCVALREINALEPAARGDFFTSLRADYPFRREFSDVRLHLSDTDRTVHTKLSGLGFTVAGNAAL